MAPIDPGVLQWAVLIILLVLTVAVLIMLVGTLLGGRKAKGSAPLSYIAEEKEVDLQPMEKVEGEIRPLLEEAESGPEFIPPENVGESGAEIRPLLDVEEPDGCAFCAIFRDLGTAVCPNCGRPFRRPPVIDEKPQ